MEYTEELLGKVSDIVARVVRPNAEQMKSPAAPRTLTGTGNVAGSGNVVLVMGAAASEVPLGDEARATLDDLVNEVAFHESIKRGKPYRAASVWLATRRALDLPVRPAAGEHGRIERYLRGWLARVAAVEPNAEAGHDEKWRKRRVARILSTCKQLDRTRQLEQLLATRYGATVLIELRDGELDEVFRAVSTWV
ncbi:hypothetical protein FHW84_002834 [Dyella sp. SG562]|uniref:hypothetical protein n=1 Tax=Dyella sp. SG562 TaxID=2587017 RepID=UPI00141ED863|nr:hypothetical protein [Dyella sp. SG562]NII74249.1 hypothetical protein [Dyella sp. SG562]